MWPLGIRDFVLEPIGYRHERTRFLSGRAVQDYSLAVCSRPSLDSPSRSAIIRNASRAIIYPYRSRKLTIPELGGGSDGKLHVEVLFVM